MIVLGILNKPEYQIVFSDTPGVIKPEYKLQENMMNFVYSAFQDADVIIYMIEIGEKGLKDQVLFERLKKTDIPILMILNKIDLSDQDFVSKEIKRLSKQMPKSEFLPISALNNFNIDVIVNKLVELLPECPPYFDKDQLTNKNMRFFVSEIVREKILKIYQKEVPYSCEVVVEEYKEDEKIVRIRANIMVSRTSQKSIVIGHQGKKIKKLGIESRIDIESFISKKVHLELFVKVDKDWRDKEGKLKKYGY